MNHLELADGGVLFFQHDMENPMFCPIRDWPAKGPILRYDCPDGRALDLEVFTENVINLNGNTMTTEKPF